MPGCRRCVCVRWQCSGAIVHGEPLGPVQWAAMACCVAALSLALLKPARPAKPVKST